MESQCGIRSISSRLKEIKKVAFDHTFEDHYFAILTPEICCVYDLDSPETIVNFLPAQHCSTAKSKSNSPSRFQSFAFCGSGQMLILTNKDIYKWDYLSCQLHRSKLTSLYHNSQRSTYRRIEYGSKGNLIGLDHCWISFVEVLSTDSLSLFHLINSDGDLIHQRPSSNGTIVLLNVIPVKKAFAFDSSIDYSKKEYSVCNHI